MIPDWLLKWLGGSNKDYKRVFKEKTNLNKQQTRRSDTMKM